jgi:hypothetical protein
MPDSTRDPAAKARALQLRAKELFRRSRAGVPACSRAASGLASSQFQHDAQQLSKRVVALLVVDHRAHERQPRLYWWLSGKPAARCDHGGATRRGWACHVAPGPGLIRFRRRSSGRGASSGCASRRPSAIRIRRRRDRGCKRLILRLNLICANTERRGSSRPSRCR